MNEYLIAGLVGLGVGLVSSVLGIGGGVLIVPLLPLLVPLTARETIATSLLTVVFVVSMNSYRFHRMHLVRWGTAIRLGVFCALGSFVAGHLTAYFSAFILHLAMGILLSWLCFLTATAEHRRKARKTGVSVARPTGGWRNNLLRSVAGVFAGLLSGFTGVSGGVIITPLLSATGWVTVPEIVPTANAAIIFAALGGTAAFIQSGWAETYVGFGHLGLARFDLAIAIFSGAFLSSSIGSRYQHRLPGRTRDWLLAVILLILAAETFYIAWLDFISR